MQIEQLAQSILYGERWEDKLATSEFLEDTPQFPPLLSPPVFPGRPPGLDHLGKADFPSPDQLKAPSARGRLLHFFANHELLAMELMALMLLRFPDAPAPFRAGIARTIQDEQNHLRLYTGRMADLGVAFGDLPVSDYFWKAMKGMESPLQFVVQMSLTLEQANLDFSLFYRRQVAAIGDEKTAAILERVYREEINHVRHGVNWFNRLRENATESDWQGYLRLLPAPMTPRRAKGPIFDEEGRRQAGLSEEFIRELEVFGGSKGRPPVFWIFNPFCELEIARGRPGLSPAAPAKRLALDLEVVPTYLARETDVVLVESLPRVAWLKEMREAGFSLPEYRRLGATELPREDKIGGIEPWGWSPEVFERFLPWRDRLLALDGASGDWCRQHLASRNFAASGLSEFFSKAWSTRFYKRWLTEHPEMQSFFGVEGDAGNVFNDWPSAKEYLATGLARGESWLAKAPWGTSGTQNRRFLRAEELDSSWGAWARKIIESQGALVVEPWLEKCADLSLQMEITESGVKCLGARRFFTGSRLEYRGTALDSKLSSLSSDELKFLHGGALDQWRRLALEVAENLRSAGYQGSAGIDALLWRKRKTLYLKPLVELNPRWTMGRVALALEEHVLPGVPAGWYFLSVEEGRQLVGRFPVRQNRSRLVEGVIFTNDPQAAREVVSALVVGDEALASLRQNGR